MVPHLAKHAVSDMESMRSSNMSKQVLLQPWRRRLQEQEICKHLPYHAGTMISGNPWQAHLSSQTALGMHMPLRPSMPAKRSKPLSFTPPKGSDWHMYVVAKSLMDVIPACTHAVHDAQCLSPCGRIEIIIPFSSLHPTLYAGQDTLRSGENACASTVQ